MKIKGIEPIAVSLPMVKPLKMSFEEVRSGENVLVRLEMALHDALGRTHGKSVHDL